MKFKKLLSVMLTFAAVMVMAVMCSVTASARATAVVTISSEPSYGGKVAFDSQSNNKDWGSRIYKSLWIDEEEVIIFAKPDPGYRFVKWGSPVDSTDDVVVVNGLQDKGSYSITAYFEKIPEPEYSITVNNGSASDYESQSQAISSVAGRKIGITADPAPQSGMVFDKWVVTSGNVTLANEYDTTTTFTMPSTSVTIEATYKQGSSNNDQKVSIYFIQGEKFGTGEYELQLEYGTTFDFPPNPFSEVKGYRFVGWRDTETSKVYKPGSKAVATEPTYYVAEYEGMSVTIHFEIYDTKTATGKMSDVQVKRGTIFTLPECTFTPKKGYVFDEWMMYGGAGSKVEIKDNITIWAKFKEDPDYSPYCIITFDNGYTGSKHDTYTEKVKKNSTYKLPKNSFLRPSKDVKFRCWDMGEVGKTVEIGDENEMTITALWSKDLSGCKINVPDNYTNDFTEKGQEIRHQFTYSSKPVIPNRITVSLGSTYLKEGVDYTVEYANNINAGKKAEIIVKGIGKYCGTAKGYFEIFPLNMNRTDGIYADRKYMWKISLSQTKYDYDGKTKRPNLLIRYKHGEKENWTDLPLSDFNITYPEKSKAVGTYKINIEAKNANVINEWGTIDKTYYICTTSTPTFKKYKETGIDTFNLYFKNLKKTYDNIEIQVSIDPNFSDNRDTSFYNEVVMRTGKYTLEHGTKKISITYKPKTHSTILWAAGNPKAYYLVIRARYIVNGAPGKWAYVKIPINEGKEDESSRTIKF